MRNVCGFFFDDVNLTSSIWYDSIVLLLEGLFDIVFGPNDCTAYFDNVDLRGWELLFVSSQNFCVFG